MLLYCVRHGESAYNAEGRIQGQSDVPLSELGRRQSAATAAALAGLPIDALYASPLRRALETAEPIAEALRLQVRTDARLMEINAGLFQDQLRADLEHLHPGEWARWLSGDPDFAIPRGESRRELMRRGGEVFREICRSGHREVAVVTHGGLLAGALKALLEIPAQHNPFVFENGSITRLELSDGKVKLLSLNQVDHLRCVGQTGRGDL
jgi:probable phosphoglycerate mutase